MKPKRISFGDLRIGNLANNRIKKAIDKNWVTEGENTQEFEHKFAKLFGYKHAVAMSSGTGACVAALASLYEFGAKRGDEVIVPATTFVATANAVLAAGFIPKFVDIEDNRGSWNINADLIENAITDNTIAVMPVHLMGKPCRMNSICNIAKKHGLFVIEDCCEAHGAKYKGKYVGSFGDMGVFSFYVAHIISCGEGGMVVTNNDKLADVVRSVKSHGRPLGTINFDFQRFGLNFKFNDLAAAIGIEGIMNFTTTFQKRRVYLFALLGMTHKLREYWELIEEGEDELISPHAFPIILANRDNLYKYLEKKGIQCKTLFGSLPTQHNAFKFLGYKKGDFPSAEYVGDHGLHFGIHHYLEWDDLTHIYDTLIRWFKSNSDKEMKR